ncbi:MAG: chloramphenicol phosphotransferase [Chloroflexi bacterium]|nr:chloramphenicol phosphotransferase [Chloroflexota bacterium]
MTSAEPPAMGQIVILNGAPRSGKTSIAAVIQDTFDGPWMNLGVDAWMSGVMPRRYSPGIGLRPGGERPDLEPLVARFYAALYESIAAYSRLGLNVVSDFGHHDGFAVPRGILPDCARRLRGLPVLLVGVRCPIEVILERRRATGWGDSRSEGFSESGAERWQREVHHHGIYDLEVDTSVMCPQECAQAIRQRLDTGPPPTAVQRLAAMSSEPP